LFSNKRHKLAELEIHQRKLNALVSDLLQKADEIDRESQERQHKLAQSWHEAFAQTCQEMVALSEVVNGIPTLIKKGDIKGSEAAMLRSTEIAKHLFNKLQESAAALK
jgi:hypothetical protein